MGGKRIGQIQKREPDDPGTLINSLKLAMQQGLAYNTEGTDTAHCG